MSVEFQFQTVTRSREGNEDARPPVSLMCAEVSLGEARAALEAIVPQLGSLIAIPAAAHESNLRSLLRRDLAAVPTHDEVTAPEGRVLLRVIREPRDDARTPAADVFGLVYEIQTLA